MWQTIKELIAQIYIPQIGIFDAIEIIVFAVVIYQLFKTIKGTRMWTVIKGLLLVLVAYLISLLFSFNALLFVFKNISFVLAILIVMVFQPEIRKFLENLGSQDYKKTLKFKRKSTTEEQKVDDNTIDEIAKAAKALSKTKTGALIAIENNIPLNEIAETGIKINADTTTQLLINIFEKNTPLHDGAVVVQNNKITAATCYLPLSENNSINKKLGTRHRAAIGLSETTDATIVVVSEETGKISIARKSKIKTGLDEEQLKEEMSIINKENTALVKPSAKDALTKNIGKKAAALVTAIVVWLIIINTENPITTRVFEDVPIVVANEQVIFDLNKTYTLASNAKVDVVVKDTRKNIERMSEKDIKVTADLENMSAVYSVPLSVNIKGFEKAKTELLTKTLQIKLEDANEVQFSIEIDKKGTPKDNCFVSEIAMNEQTVSIRGPQSIIKTIDKVVIDVDVDGVEKDTEFNSPIIIYDKNGNILQQEKVSLSAKTIKGTIKTVKTKTIPLTFILEPQNEFTKSLIKATTAEIKTVTVAENSTDEAYINIPIAITEEQAKQSSFVKNIKIADFIKDTSVLLIDTTQTTNITIEFNTNNIRKDITFKTSDIKINNLNSKYNYIFNDNEISVIFTGKKDDIINLSPENVQMEIDLKNLYGGTHNITVKITTPDGIKAANVTLSVKLVWKQ